MLFLNSKAILGFVLLAFAFLISFTNHVFGLPVLPEIDISDIVPNKGLASGETGITIAAKTSGGFFLSQRNTTVQFGNEIVPINRFRIREEDSSGGRYSIEIRSPPAPAPVPPQGLPVDVIISSKQINSNAFTFTYELTPTLFPPRQVQGVQLFDFSSGTLDIINLISWKAPRKGDLPFAYQIYRNKALTELVATVPADGQTQFTFAVHNCTPHCIHTYYIVSTDGQGIRSAPKKLEIIPLLLENFHPCLQAFQQ